jgi:hypothetical protein
MDITVGRKQVVHDDKVDLGASGEFDTVQAIEAREEGMGISLDMFVVLLEDRAEELVFGGVDGLDDEAVVAAKVEERARLARRA